MTVIKVVGESFVSNSDSRLDCSWINFRLYAMSEIESRTSSGVAASPNCGICPLPVSYDVPFIKYVDGHCVRVALDLSGAHSCVCIYDALIIFILHCFSRRSCSAFPSAFSSPFAARLAWHI